MIGHLLDDHLNYSLSLYLQENQLVLGHRHGRTLLQRKGGGVKKKGRSQLRGRSEEKRGGVKQYTRAAQSI